MGSLKQLLPYKGRTLVEHAVEQAITAAFQPVVVVVGAERAAVSAAVSAHGVEIVHNHAWQTGMGSSIVAAMRHLENKDPWAAAILVADQPLVTSHHLSAMVALLDNSSTKIVAAEYSGTLGVPALFMREMFPALASLAPQAGARDLLQKLRSEVAAYPLPEAAIDIDTKSEYLKLQRAE